MALGGKSSLLSVYRRMDPALSKPFLMLNGNLAAEQTSQFIIFERLVYIEGAVEVSSQILSHSCQAPAASAFTTSYPLEKGGPKGSNTTRRHRFEQHGCGRIADVYAGSNMRFS
jgi:hypothetical protein